MKQRLSRGRTRRRHFGRRIYEIRAMVNAEWEHALRNGLAWPLVAE